MDKDRLSQEIIELKAKLAYRKIQFIQQRSYIDKLNKSLHMMKISTSWRLTKPLRMLVHICRGD